MDERKTRVLAYKVIFIVCGVWLIGLGLYFMFLRPAFLPEDLRYSGVTLREIQSATPGIADWLRRVFTVMGGFIVGAGTLTIHAAMYASRHRKNASLAVLTSAGVFMVGAMSLTNFQLDSDFKWLLLVPSLLWLAGLVMYHRYR